jgi:hypothetical protein
MEPWCTDINASGIAKKNEFDLVGSIQDKVKTEIFMELNT